MSRLSLVRWGLSLNGGRDSNGGLSLNGELGSIMMRSMVIDMNDEQLHTLAPDVVFSGRYRSVRVECGRVD